MSRLRWGLATALLLTFIVYARLVSSYFCGFDDFTNEYRAAFEDSPNPSRVFTTTHFGGTKYRPFNRGAVLLCYWLTPDSALAHRLRNLLAHLVSVILVFAVARRLGATQTESLFAATLFGLHPLAHQSTAAAIFGVNFAYAFTLAALWMFLEAYESRGARMFSFLAGSSLTACIALLTYEPAIAVFGLYGVYCFWRWMRGEAPVAGLYQFGAPFLVSQIVPLAIFIGTRFMFVAERTPIVPLGIIIKNIAIFASALILPVDLLLLNSLFGTPLPNQALSDQELVLTIAAVGLLIAGALGIWILRSAETRRRIGGLPWWALLFLLCGIGFALVPFLVFTDHASETYAYLPAAFWSIILAIIVGRVAPPGPAYRVVAGALLVLAAAAAWMRTDRVRHCAAVAEHIVTSVPREAWKSPSSTVFFADAPGTPPLEKFGLYGYRGIATIDPGDPAFPALEQALRLRFHNTELKAAPVSPARLGSLCATPGDACYLVDENGAVTRP